MGLIEKNGIELGPPKSRILAGDHFRDPKLCLLPAAATRSLRLAASIQEILVKLAAS
jgi:hypothetical protein